MKLTDFNKRTIFNQAWRLKKGYGKNLTFAECLKTAWARECCRVEDTRREERKAIEAGESISFEIPTFSGHFDMNCLTNSLYEYYGYSGKYTGD